MAKDMKPIREQRTAGKGHKLCGVCFLCYICLLFSAYSSPGIAESLIDPTRPPSELSVSGAPSDLQSIIISPKRRAAIINGQTVELGGKAGDVKLIEVKEGSVVLQGAKGRQVLTLFPNVNINKKAVLPPIKDEQKHPARRGKLANQSTSQAGIKDEQ